MEAGQLAVRAAVAVALVACNADGSSSPSRADRTTTGVTAATTAVAPRTAPSTAASTTASKSTALETTLPKRGTGETMSFRVELVDSTRTTPDGGEEIISDQRSLPTAVYLPAGGEPAPLVVLAHGFNGSPDKFTQLAGAWADAGYVVAAPRFPLSSDTTPEPTLGDIVGQARDISFVIDEMLAANDGRPSAGGLDRVRGRVDTGRIGLYGLSLGSITVWTTVLGECCDEDRVDALIQSDGAFSPGLALAQRVDFPVMVAHADADPILGYEPARQAYSALPAPKAMLTMHGFTHAVVGENTPTAADAVYRRATTLFWDRYLRGDTTTRFPASLTVDGVTTFEHSE